MKVPDALISSVGSGRSAILLAPQGLGPFMQGQLPPHFRAQLIIQVVTDEMRWLRAGRLQRPGAIYSTSVNGSTIKYAPSLFFQATTNERIEGLGT